MRWVKIKKAIQSFDFLVIMIGMFFLVPLMLVTTIDIISRNFLLKPFPGIIELSEYALATVALLGVAYTQQVKGHLGVSFFVSRLSARNQTICQIIAAIIGLFVTTVMIWQGLIIAISERTVSDILRIPQYPFKLLVVVGGVFLWLELLIDLINTVKRCK